MKKSLLTLFAILLATLANAQISFTPSMKQTAPDEITIYFTGTIGSGWHVYAPTESNGPIPATFNIDKIEGAKPVGQLTANKAATKKYEDMFGAEVSFYEHSVTFSQKVKLTGPTYKIEGYLQYGACDDQSCMPPTAVDFKYSGKGVEKAAATAADEKGAAEATTADAEAATVDAAADSTAAPADSLAQAGITGNDMWRPVIDKLNAFDGGDTEAGASLWRIFILGILGGFIALLTPCVWPIIPMTVSFFLKRAKDDKKKGVRDAFTYGISIIVIYLVLGLAVTLLFGASALNALSTNAVFNIFFFLLLVVFGASFLGGFEIMLPSSWTNAVDSKAS